MARVVGPLSRLMRRASASDGPTERAEPPAWLDRIYPSSRLKSSARRLWNSSENSPRTSDRDPNERIEARNGSDMAAPALVADPPTRHTKRPGDTAGGSRSGSGALGE